MKSLVQIAREINQAKTNSVTLNNGEFHEVMNEVFLDEDPMFLYIIIISLNKNVYNL